MCRSARERTELLPINPTPETTVQKLPRRGSWLGQRPRLMRQRGSLKHSRNNRRIHRNATPYTPVLRILRLKTSTYQRNRRERPMCRSAPESTEPLPMKNRNAPHCVIPTAAQAEWRNPPRGRKVPPQGKICHLGRFLTPFHYARNDMPGVVLFYPQGL